MSMEILVHSEGFHLSDEAKAKIAAKVGRLEHFARRVLRARATLKRVSAHPSSSQFEAHILLEVPGNDINGAQKASEPMEALDLLIDKLEQQLRKRKTARLARRERARATRLASAT